jgi:ATP-binding cassette subfamily B protein
MATYRPHSAAPTGRLRGNEWRAVATLVPYLLEYKWRVAGALACLVAA